MVQKSGRPTGSPGSGGPERGKSNGFPKGGARFPPIRAIFRRENGFLMNLLGFILSHIPGSDHTFLHSLPFVLCQYFIYFIYFIFTFSTPEASLAPCLAAGPALPMRSPSQPGSNKCNKRIYRLVRLPCFSRFPLSLLFLAVL